MAKKSAPKSTAKPTAKKAPAKTVVAKKVATKKSAPKKALVKTAKPAAKKLAKVANPQEVMRDKVVAALDKMKAESVLVVDVRGQSSLTDFFVIASGRSNRQVKSLADSAAKALQECGAKNIRTEGLPQADWAVVDGGDVIVHIFRPEVRNFYRLEEVWGLEPPLQETFRDL